MNYRRYRSDKVAKGVSSPDRIKARKVPHGYILEVTHFSAGIATEETRIIEIGYQDSTGFDKILRKSKPSPFKGLVVSGHIWLEEDEIPYVEVTNLDSGSEYYLSVHGRLWPKDGVIGQNAKVQ